jgi:hypothetical protein
LSRFDIPVDRSDGVHSLLICAPAVHWGLPPATRLASRTILLEQNIKRRTGPAFYVFFLLVPNYSLGVLSRLYVKLVLDHTTEDVEYMLVGN